ncbi:MAG: c-type cytochrome biogenesis protein CcmI [Paracoccaceae bacterium]
MLFWTITGLIVLAVFALFARAIAVGHDTGENPAAYDLRVYRDQLDEVDRDVARGVLNDTDAERVRTEISRRILAVDSALNQTQTGLGQTGTMSRGLLGFVAATIGLGAFGIYTQLGAPGYGDLRLQDRIEQAAELRAGRPDQATAEASITQNAPPTDENAEYTDLVEQLRKAISQRPDDLRGYRLLVRAEARLGNLVAAHQAQERVIELSGGQDADISELTDYADMMILAAGGFVSPEAERVLKLVLDREPGNPIALYYWGLLERQTGRPDTAFRIWDQLLRRGPAQAPWIEPILAQIEEVAAIAGVRYQVPQVGSGRGPTGDDIAAAQDMSPAQRMEMIQGMVSGLSDRLATEGGPPQDWAQLISALGVLGRMDQAAIIFDNAREVFGEDPSAMDMINQAADRAGLQ